MLSAAPENNWGEKKSGQEAADPAKSGTTTTTTTMIKFSVGGLKCKANESVPKMDSVVAGEKFPTN